ncbi:MAG: high light inducible protein [Cyanobium sp. CZS 48M]|nr:high light inducible protein [Cyanobium sp. CZS48M]
MGRQQMAPAEISENRLEPVDVDPQELNAWRRGFTPQAEIWNGRLAMLGLSLGLASLLLIRLATRS